MKCKNAHKLRNDLQAVYGWFKILQISIEKRSADEHATEMLEKSINRIIENSKDCVSGYKVEASFGLVKNKE